MLLTSCSYMFKKSYKINAPEPQLYFATGEELKMATAIYDGDLHSIQSMIDNGFDLNRIGRGGMTYLYYAMLTMNYDTMELLLKNGQILICIANSLHIQICIRKDRMMSKTQGFALNILGILLMISNI